MNQKEVNIIIVQFHVVKITFNTNSQIKNLEVMTDPVSTPYGHTFQRSAILDWLKKSKTCPITKKPLNENDLATNYALRDAVKQLIINKNINSTPKEKPFNVDETKEKINKLTWVVNDESKNLNPDDINRLLFLSQKVKI